MTSSLEDLFTAHMNRPMPTFLNGEVLAATPDDAVEDKIYDFALAKIGRDFKKEEEVISSLALGEDPLPLSPHFYDHLTPAVLLSMNTGLRRGELLKLQWSSIDLGRRWLTVEGGSSKTRQTRHVPLNDEAIRVLNRWREQSGSCERVFAIVTGLKTAWAKLLTRADISRFRWHDLRHHFASRIVQRGVPLNTVRDLGPQLSGDVTALRTPSA